MPEITIRHEIDCDEDTFWDKIFLNEEFNRKLFIDVLHFPAFNVLESNSSGDKRTRRVHVEPVMGNLPGPVKKVFGDKATYTEEGSFDTKTKRYSFKMIPSVMPDKMSVTGEVYCEKLGDKKIARIAKVRAEVKVFMVGSVVEEKILGDTKASFGAAADFTNKYIKEQGM